VLSHYDLYPAYGRRHFHPDLWSVELQDHAPGVLQLYATGAGSQRATRADYAVTPREIAGRPDVQGPSHQLCSRRSDREAQAHARDIERVVMTPERQDSVATADADDESPFREDNADRPGFGLLWRGEAACKQCNHGNLKESHAVLFHWCPL
jgi:hypothetical protein